MITFPVSSVEADRGPLQLSKRDRRGWPLLPDRVEAIAYNLPDPVKTTANGLLSAVHNAFASHRPLALSPDDVWLCLVQGLATHVNLHAEELRDRFVSHAGKLTLTVRRDDLVRGDSKSDWPGAIAALSAQVEAHLGTKRDLVLASHTTTGPIERTAFEIALLDTVRSYFSFRVLTVCGIPEITLLGTAEDWRSIRTRAESFAELGLARWTQALIPVLDEIERSARGEVDRAFWQSVYKFHERSGGDSVTGWIQVLFPYLRPRQKPGADGRPVFHGNLVHWREQHASDEPGGAEFGAFPSGISTVPLSWHDRGTELRMALAGGFLGIAQDRETGAVRPTIGWAVHEA